MSISEENLYEIQQKIGYCFINKDLLRQAFTRSSYSVQYGTESNEVLEFIGDTVLDFVVVDILTERYGMLKDKFYIVNGKKEDDFTKLKEQIVSNSNLAHHIDKLDLAKYVYLGDCDIKNGVINQKKVKADLFEAILGAIAIDSKKVTNNSIVVGAILNDYNTTWNLRKLKNSIEKMLQIDDFLNGVDVQEALQIEFNKENAINTLKELSEQGGKYTIPEYSFSTEQIYYDDKYCWACDCKVWEKLTWYNCFNNRISIKRIGYATTKKEAKKNAAYQVLCDMFSLQDKG